MSPASDPHIITGSHTLSVYSSSCTLYNGEPICSTRFETKNQYNLISLSWSVSSAHTLQAAYLYHYENIKDHLRYICKKLDRFNSNATTGTLILKLSIAKGVISPMMPRYLSST